MDNIFAIIERYWDNAPVDIVFIIRDAGLIYVETPLWDSESGRLEAAGSKYRIVVNSQHPKVRRRFTAAHELGHYVYHRDLIGDGISDIAYRTSDKGRYHNARITARHESEANRFAATVLMPMQLISKLSQTRALGKPESESARLARIAAGLEVSEQALRIRLGVDH